MKCKEKRLTTEVAFVLTNALKYCLGRRILVLPQKVHALLLGFDSLLDDVCEHIRNKKTPPHGRVCLMEFLTQSLKGKFIGNCLL